MYDEHRWFSLFFRRFVEFYNREICLLGYTFILDFHQFDLTD